MPIRDSWRRRGHSPSCWLFHGECALRSALDMARTREAQARGEAQLYSAALQKLRDDIEDPEALEMARKVLKNYHRMMKATARRE